MKKIWIVVLAFWSAGAFAQDTETRNLSSFTGVKVSEGIDVILKKGDKESAKVEITGTGAGLKDVMTEVSGSYLKVHMRDGNYRGRYSVKVYVTYVKVDKMSASSAGSIFAEGTVNANSMEIDASSAGTIEISLQADDVEASASSAGDVELKGKCKSLRAEAVSAGEVDAYDLEAENVEAEASSGGSVKINVTKTFEAQASSGGSIRYRGNPDRNNTSSSSGGSVKKSN